jgi:hypothetical protein
MTSSGFLIISRRFVHKFFIDRLLGIRFLRFLIDSHFILLIEFQCLFTHLFLSSKRQLTLSTVRKSESCLDFNCSALHRTGAERHYRKLVVEKKAYLAACRRFRFTPSKTYSVRSLLVGAKLQGVLNILNNN